MNINILEKDSFIYDENKPKKKYKPGQALVELAKCDFSKLKKFIQKEIPDNLTYEDFFKELFNFDYHSIFYLPFKNSLKNFYNNFDDSVPDEVPFPFSTINDPYNFKHSINLFFQPLFDVQDALNKFLFNISSDSIDRREMLSLIYILSQDLIKSENKNKDLIYYQYDAYSSEPIFNIDSNFAFKIHFSDIESFILYEIKRLYTSDTKIILCPTCQKLYVAKNGNQKYCSNKCKYEANKKNNNTNIFYIEYRKRYKTLYSKYFVKKLDDLNYSAEILPQEIKEALITLRDKYMTKNQNNSKIIEEYKQKLRAIK